MRIQQLQHSEIQKEQKIEMEAELFFSEDNLHKK